MEGGRVGGIWGRWLQRGREWRETFGVATEKRDGGLEGILLYFKDTLTPNLTLVVSPDVSTRFATMLLKISLALAILVGLATLYFTMPVKEKIDTLTSTLAATESAKAEAEAAQAKATDEAKKSKAALEATSKELGAVTNMLAAVSTRLTEQEKRANKASTELLAVTEERNEARQELNKWTILGLPPERIREELETKRKLETERTALTAELKTFSRNNTELQARLDRYEGDMEKEVPLPAGTKGKIVAVDPKYDFVVLDIGGNQGILQNAKMLVNRDGKLVAKVKITHVEPNRAIANIMPEWKQDDVIEGDQVVY